MPALAEAISEFIQTRYAVALNPPLPTISAIISASEYGWPALPVVVQTSLQGSPIPYETVLNNSSIVVFDAVIINCPDSVDSKLKLSAILIL